MVAVVNKSTVVTDAEVAELVELTNKVMVRDIAPAYGRLPWSFRVGGKANVYSYIVDEDKDVPGALAYHDTTDAGKAFMVTMAKTILDSGASLFGPDGVLSAHLHEVGETFNDVPCNKLARGPDGRVWWWETCDAVQGEDYEIDVGSGRYAPNFCLPEWFDPKGTGRVDFAGNHPDKPFFVAPQGYQVVADCGAESQIGGAYIVDAYGNQRGGGLNAWRTLKITGI